MNRDDQKTIAGLLRERADDDHPALLFEDEKWTWAEFVAESVARAHLLRAVLDPAKPLHVGVMLENHPEYLFLLGGAAFAGATVVGVNLTRRGGELADDIVRSDCQVIVTDTGLRHHLQGLDLGGATDRVLTIDSAEYRDRVDRHRGQELPNIDSARDPRTILLLMFTSGSTGNPKAVICTTGRLARIAAARHMNLGRDDVSYNAMPLFHGNALFACWANTVATGGTCALARRFSASRFVDDLIKFGATYFNYVGRSLAYVLAQPERPEERKTKLHSAFGTEASRKDREEFARRFGVEPTESYGASEGALAIWRTDDTPEDSIGRPRGAGAVILDPATMEECPRARFDEAGRLLNPDEAIGEIANPLGARAFEGYYRNPEATDERIRGDAFLTGDLGYRDAEGFFYFAGRSGDRLRVDSENFSAGPVERILTRHPSVSAAAVYPVPDERTGDQVMATLQLSSDSAFDPQEFADFLGRQDDLGTKWAPKYIRLIGEFPTTATSKVNKPQLRQQMWLTDDPVYYRPAAEIRYRVFTDEDRERIGCTFVENGREKVLARNLPRDTDECHGGRDQPQQNQEQTREAE